MWHTLQMPEQDIAYLEIFGVSNNDIESETPDSEVVDYGDPNVDSSFEVEDDDYGFGRYS